MSRPSRFMRSMTPSGSVKMSASKFNVVCGKTREIACTPNIDRIPNPRPPKVFDAKVTTPTLSRREMPFRRDRSVTRDTKPPLPSAASSRDSTSNYLPFGSYADIGCHTKAPTRYGMTSGYTAYSERMDRSRRSTTPLTVSSIHNPSYSSSNRSTTGYEPRSRRASFCSQQSFYSQTSASSVHSSSSSTEMKRQRHSSCSFGTPASARGIPFYWANQIFRDKYNPGLILGITSFVLSYLG